MLMNGSCWGRRWLRKGPVTRSLSGRSNDQEIRELGHLAAVHARKERGPQMVLLDRVAVTSSSPPGHPGGNPGASTLLLACTPFPGLGGEYRDLTGGAQPPACAPQISADAYPIFTVDLVVARRALS